MNNKKSIKEIVESIFKRMPNGDLEYYCITIVANEDGNPSWDVQTKWVGFADDECKIELRQACLVDSQRIVKIFREDLNEGCLIVETLNELKVFLLLGGHAVVEKSIAEQALSEFLKSHPTIQTGLYGFQSLKDFPNEIFQRAPTKKQRIRILKRDNFRCRVCGRSPKDYVDITLHIHHIRPWANRGLTHDKNLITLCHTCHEGLDPHFEPSLFGLLTDDSNSEGSRKHLESVRRYRDGSFKKVFNLNIDSNES